VAGMYDTRSHDILWYWLTRICGRSPFLARRLEIFGNIASFASWQSARGFDTSRRDVTREPLWRAASSALRTGKATVLESMQVARRRTSPTRV
jgi:hypothetical protein